MNLWKTGHSEMGPHHDMIIGKSEKSTYDHVLMGLWTRVSCIVFFTIFSSHWNCPPEEEKKNPQGKWKYRFIAGQIEQYWSKTMYVMCDVCDTLVVDNNHMNSVYVWQHFDIALRSACRSKRFLPLTQANFKKKIRKKKTTKSSLWPLFICIYETKVKTNSKKELKQLQRVCYCRT